MAYTIGLYVMAALYFLAGVMHLVKPALFLRVVPRWLPARMSLVILSGVVEIVLAIGLLFPQTRQWAAWGLIAMLVSYFLVHVNMVVVPKAGLGLPPVALWVRLALQFGLIYWAYQYTR